MQQHPVRRFVDVCRVLGLMEALLNPARDPPALQQLANDTTGGENPEHVEGLLRSVFTMRSEGTQGTTIGLLLGLEQGRRGANPTTLREAAAQRLGYHSVDTFRKRPEQNAFETFAYLLVSYRAEYQNLPAPEDYRVERCGPFNN